MGPILPWSKTFPSGRVAVRVIKRGEGEGRGGFGFM